MIIQTYRVEQDDYVNAGKASSQIKMILKQFGIHPEKLRRMSVACYEAEINMIIHSYGGQIELSIEEDQVLLKFTDKGPGIPDLHKAMEPGWSTANEKARTMGFGAGMGLVNIKRVSDSFNITSSKDGTQLIVGFKSI